MEIQSGIMNAQRPSESALVFMRTLPGMNINNIWQVSKFIDFRGLKEDKEAKELLTLLRNQSIPKYLSAENILSYKVDFDQYSQLEPNEINNSGNIPKILMN